MVWLHTISIHIEKLKRNRSQGYGKLTISALEKRLSTIGISEIKLRVAFKNKRALKLYDEVGFKITGYNMSKHIG